MKRIRDVLIKDELTEGDEVAHKTQPQIKMIYIGEADGNEALCSWVDTKGEKKRDSFAFTELQKWEAPQSPSAV